MLLVLLGAVMLGALLAELAALTTGGNGGGFLLADNDGMVGAGLPVDVDDVDDVNDVDDVDDVVGVDAVEVVTGAPGSVSSISPTIDDDVVVVGAGALCACTALTAANAR